MAGFSLFAGHMKKKGGRPSKFQPTFCEQAKKLCRLGATTPELADFFNVAVSTVDKWIAEIPKFSDAVKEAKAIADDFVVRRLFERATGYSHPDTHVSNYQGDVTLTPITKHYAPDTAAAIFWLKNRRSDAWRDRLEHTGKDGGAIPIQNMTDIEAARAVAFAMASGAEAVRKAQESSKEAA